ncbi:MAG: SDR family NAD(P)-dependent oxidoreductase [Gemmatimonadales bacterium]
MRQTRRRRRRLLIAAGACATMAWRLRRRPPEYDIAGQTVLITGGSRGLGLALAQLASEHGARVAICGRNVASLERARSLLRSRGADVVATPCDVRDQGSVRQLIDTVRSRLGPVDVLINNAGAVEVGPAAAMSVADYQEALDTNFWGVLHTILAVLPEMRARGSGRIVNITSVGGRIGVPHLIPYSASKFAAVGLTQALRAELASEGITVMAVVPGLMRTGSPRNAVFRGRHRAEYAWFSIADSLPGLSISVKRAARLILAACARGDAEARFPLSSRLAAVANGVAPGLTSLALTAAARLLPRMDPTSGARFSGRESQSPISPSWLTWLGDRAARRYNQMVPAESAAG